MKRMNEKLIRIVESSIPFHHDGELYSREFGRFLGFSHGMYRYAPDWTEGLACAGIAQISSKIDYRLKAIKGSRC